MITEFKRTQRNFLLSFKIAIVEQVEKSEMTYKQTQQRYGIQRRSTVLVQGRLDWITGLSDQVKRKLPVAQTIVPLTPEQRAREPEKQLELTNQKFEFFESVINILKNDYGVSIVNRLQMKGDQLIHSHHFFHYMSSFQKDRYPMRLSLRLGTLSIQVMVVIMAPEL